LRHDALEPADPFDFCLNCAQIYHIPDSDANDQHEFCSSECEDEYYEEEID
jgi:hypothetical protein